MTEEDQSQLEYEEDDYYEDEGDDLDNEAKEEEYNQGEDAGDIHIGEDIDLTHEEVWDDSALIEAWDVAVKQYEVYHSKITPYAKAAAVAAISSSVSQTKAKDAPPTTPSSPSKSAKLNSETVTSTSNVDSKISNSKGHMAIQLDEEAPEPATIASTEETVQKPSMQTTGSCSSSSTDYAVTERKPSFRKADKPSFNHRPLNKDQPASENAKRSYNNTQSHGSGGVNNKRLKTSGPSTTTTKRECTAHGARVAHENHPVIDAATIAYYQQLGYYYDPSYDTSSLQHAAETEHINQEQEGEEDDTQATPDDEDRALSSKTKSNNSNKNNNRAPASSSASAPAGAASSSSSNTANAGTSSAYAKNRRPGAGMAAAASNTSAHTPSIFGSGHMPMPAFSSEPYSQHQPYPYQQGIYLGYPPHIPAGPRAATSGPAPGGFGIPPAWGAHGPGMGAVPMPFRQGPIPTDVRQHHQQQHPAMGGMMPPPPAPPGVGPFSATGSGGMDEDALSNLIMAWYFSGYYTGLYQAQQQQRR